MASKAPDTKDRRVQRTRRTLREALIALMLEKGWDGFSVQDVCERADVGRSTFYTHFADKEELLTGGFDDLRKLLRTTIASVPSSPNQPLRFVRGMIDHAREHHRLFVALLGKRSGQVVLRRFRDLVLDLVREDLAQLPVKVPASTREAAVRFLGGAFLEVLSWWLEAKAPLGPDEVERVFQQMASPALRTMAG